MEPTTAGERCQATLDRVSDAVIAENDFLSTVLTGVLSRGHVLIEDVPGTGKTLTARTLAETLGLSFSRIQFTPDLLPTDVTGTHIFDEQENTFEFNEGPVFANMVLADEINRAPPKTQAALLEAMGEGQVTVDGDRFDLPEPFFVIATQNPVEQEGTFPLPEAQLDRFIIKTEMGYPGPEGELELLNRREKRNMKIPTADTQLTPDEVQALQQVPEQITVTEDLKRYMIQLTQATRDDNRTNIGVSPRGLQRLYEASRARAVMLGRDYVTPEDVQQLAQPVLAHRLVLETEAKVNDVSKRDIVDNVLQRVSVPGAESSGGASPAN
ncbi:AAA family ATPase [Halorientalis pallida]|uniref:MoxR family ATPase n=1 Tax=Halorientalis pallida TaxID=2479928 RepID=A0A498KT24_9EURY|nr:MoxR family ATPase [Halorientalis pallida]RXK47806.1 MoxR family ATPase [Halorientalis pallida]